MGYAPPPHQKILHSLEVTIVYSGSDGSIHAVHSDAKYQASPNTVGVGNDRNVPKSFLVEYKWVNEADVDEEVGLLALFLAVLIVSLSGLFGACISSEGEQGTRYATPTTSEGFA